MPSDKTSWKTPLVAMKLAAILLIGMLLIGIYLKSESEGVQNQISHESPARKAVSTRIQEFQDKTLDLTSFNLPQAEYLLIGFWATWCPTCKPELKDIDQLYKTWTAGNKPQISTEKLKVVSINVDPPQNAKKVDELWKSLNLDIQLHPLPESNILDAMEIEVLPSYVLIKNNKMYLLKMDGATDWSSDKIQNQILKHLK